MPTVPLGTRIRARWLRAKPLGTYSLAGMQLKMAVDQMDVTGLLVGVHGDDPVNPSPKSITITIKADDGEEHTVNWDTCSSITLA